METVIDTDGLLVRSIAVDHGPVPALAFRIDYKGHSIVYSGDTASHGPNMITIAQDADVLICHHRRPAPQPGIPCTAYQPHPYG